MSIWDYCNVEGEQLKCINEVNLLLRNSEAPACAESVAPSTMPNSSQVEVESFTGSEYDAYVSLRDIETSCRTFMSRIDEVLKTLDDISVSYDDVTSRTNVLMVNCEALLEQQVYFSLSNRALLI